MAPIKLGNKVRIKQNEREGVVRGICHLLYAEVQYQVRYANMNGLLTDDWFAEQEIGIVEDEK